MGERNSITNAQKQSQPVRAGLDRLDVLVQALPFDQLHGIEHAAILQRPYIVDRNDAWMFKAGEYLGFSKEAASQVGAAFWGVEDF
jgi:hypothetical protein